MTKEQKEFARLIELNRKQAESLLEDTKKQMEDVNKRLSAAKSLKLIIDNFAEMNKPKEITRLPLHELKTFLMEHRN